MGSTLLERLAELEILPRGAAEYPEEPLWEPTVNVLLIPNWGDLPLLGPQPPPRGTQLLTCRRLAAPSTFYTHI